MRCQLILVCVLAPFACRADVSVVVEHNADKDATGEFKFSSLPPPSNDDAAAGRAFRVIDGTPDPNSGKAAVLTDGARPAGHDDPGSNFFFAQGLDGGRLVLDLGRTLTVKQINTYSWHSDTRAPQVYFLYAADGSARGFSPVPKRQLDPENAGWDFVAAVDTRREAGDGGGQYGVSISADAGSLGRYRYFLLDIRRTERDDPFGNTFYSEIDVIAAPESPDAAPASAMPHVP